MRRHWPLVVAAPLLILALALAACRDGEKTFASECQKSDRKQWPEPPEMFIDTSKTYVATIVTEKGDIKVELYSDVPMTTNNFVFLACKGFYDGLTFHRVIPGFLAQAGDPEGEATGPGYLLPDEPDGNHTFEPGVISMAKAGPDTASSQFFITFTRQPRLEPDFTVFGRVTSLESIAVMQQLTPRNPDEDPDAPPGDTIEEIIIEELDGPPTPP